LAAFPTKEATLEFFERNRAYFTVGSFAPRNFQVNGVFSLRVEDDTPSAHAKPLLKWIDFGLDGRVHSIIDLILMIGEERLGERRSFPWAVEELERLVKEAGSAPVEGEIDPDLFKPKEKKVLPPYSAYYIQKRVEDAERNREIFEELLSGLCRTCSASERERARKLFRMGLAFPRNDSHEDFPRLFVPEFDSDLVAWGSYRYKRDATPKGLLRRDSKRLLFGGHLLRFFNGGPIIFSEGHSDTVVNNAKGLRCVTTGSATTPLRDNVEALKGREVHIFYDLDKPGVLGTINRMIEIARFNDEVEEGDRIKVVPHLWSQTMVDREEKEVDVVTAFDEEISKLLEREKMEHLKEEVHPSAWRVVSRKPLKKGFDWIDFHGEFSGAPNYGKFLRRYRYL